MNCKTAEIKPAPLVLFYFFFLPRVLQPLLWSLSTKRQKQPPCKDQISYAFLTINVTIQLDRNANAVSEAFSACCAPLMDANHVPFVWVCIHF